MRFFQIFAAFSEKKSTLTRFHLCEDIFYFHKKKSIQCNLDLVTVDLVTTCDLVTILQRPFFNLLHKIICFSDIMQFSDSFCGDQTCH